MQRAGRKGRYFFAAYVWRFHRCGRCGLSQRLKTPSIVGIICDRGTATCSTGVFLALESDKKEKNLDAVEDAKEKCCPGPVALEVEKARP